MNIHRFKLTINNLRYICQELYKIVVSDKEYEIVVRDWSEKRTLSANAQQWVWYKQISNHYGSETKQVARECKLDFGLPIVLRNPKYGPVIDYTLNNIGFHSMMREDQIKVIDIVQITSLFNTKEHNEYRENLQDYYGQIGVNLEYRD